MNVDHESIQPPTRRPRISHHLRPWLVVALLIFGVEVSLNCSPNFDFTTPFQRNLIIVVLALALLPITARPIAYALDRFQRISRRTRRILTILVFLAATGMLLHAIHMQRRDLGLKYHDEFSYALQARMLASGRLWMPPHPLSDFFDSFQVIVDPVYCSMYFPGTAILLVPGVWFHWPYWFTAVLVCGACMALTYYVVARLVNEVAGILAALIVLENGLLHYNSIRVLSNAPEMFYGLAAIAAWLCWSETRAEHRLSRARLWAVAVGLMLGLAAITRPLDALCVALPIGCAMALAIWRTAATSIWPIATFSGRIVALGLFLLLGMAPSLTLQMIFDKGVTGSLFRSPFDLYAERDYPQTSFGFHTFDPTLYPKSVVPEKQARPAQHTWGFVRDHTPLNALKLWKKRIPGIITDTMDDPLILVLLPLGLLTMRPRQWVMGSILFLFPFLYYFYTFYFPHYTIILIPAMALAAVVGANEVSMSLPRIRRFAQVSLALGIAVICITDLPELHRARLDDFPGLYPETKVMDAAVASLPPGRAVVLFRFVDKNRTEEEPVHNETVLWPDDAQVIRAQDLGHRDIELFRYYAKIQPDRVAFIFDRGNDTIHRLGRVDVLAARGAYNPTDNFGGTPK
jgi:hypothetical protein